MEMGDSKNFEVAEFLKVAFKDTTGAPEPISWKQMVKMLEDTTHADVTFKVAGGEIVKAHRAVLALFSPVFNTMFSCGMREHRTSIVELAHMDVEALRLFLVMLYSGVDCKNVKPNLLEKDLTEVMAVCHKYQVAQAIPTLCAHMMKNFGIQNCCHYFICTNKFSSQDGHTNMAWLGQTVQTSLNNVSTHISSFTLKHFDLVVKTDGFMYLARTHHKLAVQLMRTHMTIAPCKRPNTSAEPPKKSQLLQAIMNENTHRKPLIWMYS